MVSLAIIINLLNGMKRGLSYSLVKRLAIVNWNMYEKNPLLMNAILEKMKIQLKMLSFLVHDRICA